MVLMWRKQDCTTLYKSESKITPMFLAVGLILLDNGPRLMGLVMVVGGLNNIISDLELKSWRKLWAIQRFSSSRQSKTAARLLGSLGHSGRYIFVSSA